MDAADLERHVDAAAALIGLAIAPAHRPGVISYFGLAASQAALLMDFALTSADEPAEVFVPVEPGSP